jgi:hypothetical protein
MAQNLDRILYIYRRVAIEAYIWHMPTNIIPLKKFHIYQRKHTKHNDHMLTKGIPLYYFMKLS